MGDQQRWTLPRLQRRARSLPVLAQDRETRTLQRARSAIGWSSATSSEIDRANTLLLKHCMEPFVYSQLTSPNSIRLLRIHPARRSSFLLECTIFEADLSSKVEHAWIAISYAWGDLTRPRPILLNDCYYETTKSSYDALIRFRSEIEPVVVWIDALCIDQKNEIEKDHQVSRMASIYREASCVHIWLGHPDADQALVCDFITHSQTLFDQGLLPHRGGFSSESYTEVLYRATGATAQSSIWKMMHQFFEIQWFSRKWVVQESVLATRRRMFCGKYEISWDRLLDFAYHILCGTDFAIAWGYFLAMDKVYNFLKMCQVELDFVQKSREETLPASQLFDMVNSLEVTNPRDVVYGMLGLLEHTDTEKRSRAPLLIDYSLSLAETFTNTTWWCIMNDNGLDILSLVSGRRYGLGFEFPSWVPDLRWQALHVPFAHLSTSASYSGKSHWYEGHTMDIEYCGSNGNDSGPTLRTQGYLPDRIDRLSKLRRPRWSPDELPNSGLVDGMIAWCVEVFALCKCLGTGSTLSIWRTLLAYGESQISWCSASDEVILDHAAILTEQLFVDPSCHRLSTHHLIRRSRRCLFVRAEMQASLADFIKALQTTTTGRRFAILESGDTALVTDDAEAGDFVAMIPGGAMPMIISRIKAEELDYYHFHGEAYVHSLRQWRPTSEHNMVPIHLV